MPITIPDPNEDRRLERSRIQCLTIMGDMLLHLLDSQQRRGNLIRLVPGQLPEDARCVGLSHDPVTNAVRLYVHSATFDPTDQGSISPEMRLSHRIIRLPTMGDIEQDAIARDRHLDNDLGIANEVAALKTGPTTDSIKKAKQGVGESLIDLLIECDVLADK